MLMISCFNVVRRKKDKEDKHASKTDNYYEKLKSLKERNGRPAKFTETDKSKLASSITPLSNMEVMSHGNPTEREREVAYEEGEEEENISMKGNNSGFHFQPHIVGSSEENYPSMIKKIESVNSLTNMSEKPSENIAYEGEDEQEENVSMKRNNSDFHFQPYIVGSSEENYPSMIKKIESVNSLSNMSDKPSENVANRDDEEDFGYIQSGHVSDPGIGRQELWASPKLVRSCSLVETGEVLKTIAYQLPPSKDMSYEDLQKLAEEMHSKVLYERGQSPISVMTHQSADRVMLKKHSSSQILPSQSRRLWWKLFLWSHRNMPKPLSAFSKTHSFPTTLNQQGGYCSDNFEPNGDSELNKIDSPNSFTELSMNKGHKEDTPCWDGFHGTVSGFWPQNQWVALSAESPLPRVEQWVQELANQPSLLVDNDDQNDSTIDYPPSPETSRAPSKNMNHLNRRSNVNISEEIMHANSIIQSLNISSTVAHMPAVGLKVIPTLLQFHSLRSVNLSGNSIAHITPGSLPKGLHTLNLSRNKITAIEGLRELTRLRVLDLSYNKISRIGHGLSNCSLIKELYLAGNKISEVEGLHRLLKLSVLDLSFNKISTTKALGQLVANYSTLLALNLLGNAIQNSVSDDQLRKAVCGLLPKLAYLNKQPVNSQKAREVASESIVKAALGNSTWSSRKRGVRKVSHGRLGSSSGHQSTSRIGQTSSRASSRGRVQRH